MLLLPLDLSKCLSENAHLQQEATSRTMPAEAGEAMSVDVEGEAEGEPPGPDMPVCTLALPNLTTTCAPLPVSNDLPAAVSTIDILPFCVGDAFLAMNKQTEANSFTQT